MDSNSFDFKMFYFIDLVIAVIILSYLCFDNRYFLVTIIPYIYVCVRSLLLHKVIVKYIKRES